MPDIPEQIARQVLEIASDSMDAGSGMLDDEQVIALRQFARCIGVDPDSVTPDEWDTKSGAVRVENEHAATKDFNFHVAPPTVTARCLCGRLSQPREFQMGNYSADHEERRRQTEVAQESYERALAEVEAEVAQHLADELDHAREGGAS